MSSILIVDDDNETCRFMAELLSGPDRQIHSASRPDAAMAMMRERAFDLVISDINLNAEMSGLDLLKAFKESNPLGQVLLISGFGTLETAIQAVRQGAFDYISKPFSINEVKSTTERALAHAGLAQSAPLPAGATVAPGLIGRTAGMVAVYKQIAHAADSMAPVLVVGESGTGKELVARAIHDNSARAKRPFVAINCAAIPETLLESELFGHTRGAFTGAVADRKGIFEQAHGGTVLLDEIGDTSLALQVRLLRVLEESEVRPVGSTRALRVDARVVASTNADLEQAVSAGRFRQDLFYRLSVIVIHLPPLRDRRSDIPLLIESFLQDACRRAGRRVDVSPDAIDALTAYDWPGNVRELENTIERLVVLGRASTIEVADLPPGLIADRTPVHERLFSDLPSLEELERRYLLHVLSTVAGNRTRAADVLGVDRRTLYRMAERFGIDLKDEAS
ncbi:MAG: sigma-54 dependent transcriptional regulator [Vicinamibacterales bacterium]